MANPKTMVDRDPLRWKRLWRDNHGTLLVIWAFVILLAGLGVIIYRQTRFVPPSFPDASAIGSQRGAGGDGAASDDARSAAAIVRVHGAASDRGMVHVAVFDARNAFPRPDTAHVRALLEIEGGEATWTVPRTELPETFALSAFHDANNDGRLNRDEQGRAAELRAFSNQAEATGSEPPTFEQAALPRPMPGEVIELQLR